jgi:hypothetical protein
VVFVALGLVVGGEVLVEFFLAGVVAFYDVVLVVTFYAVLFATFGGPMVSYIHQSSAVVFFLPASLKLTIWLGLHEGY